MPKLKVYRTSIGFHDAYVAAASPKAALKAWGSEHDLLARGVAEVITDPALMREPLAHPGEVIKRCGGQPPSKLSPKFRRPAAVRPATTTAHRGIGSVCLSPLPNAFIWRASGAKIRGKPTIVRETAVDAPGEAAFSRQ